MNYNFLMIFWFFVISVAWVVYIILESIVVGSGILTLFFRKDKELARKLQKTTALHQEGVEVWLITAIGGTFAAFPLMYATSLSALYIPVFLLIILLITRGVSLEFMYKDDNPLWQKVMFNAWSISSLLIPLVVAIYLFSNFTGLRFDNDGMHDPFYKIFTSYSIIFGSVFVAAASAVGVSWAKFHVDTKSIETKLNKIAIVCSAIVIFGIILTFMQFNTKIGLFNKSELFENPIFYIFPLITIIFGIISFISAFLKKNILLFISLLLTQGLFILTCFLVTYPVMLLSKIDEIHNVTIIKAAAGVNTLQVMFIAVIIVLPIVIAYQSWKFIKFFKK